ncbi:MAG: FG-GAP repeat domain-containing protein [Candidatus Thorarchaeota archaeon]
MPELRLLFSHQLKEVVTNLEIVDMTGDGRDNIVVGTISGSLKVFEYQDGEKKPKEIASLTNLVPVSSLGVGDVTGNDIPDLVVGGLDNTLKVVGMKDNKLEVLGDTTLGNLPTALVVANVLDDKKAEVIAATNDKALRCYGWYGSYLDKLAHKVVDRPVFSMMPIHIDGTPYSRFVFGDDSETLYLYQYADDRLHQIGDAKVNGEVNLVATGRVIEGRLDNVATASNGNHISLFDVSQKPVVTVARIRAPKPVTSIKVGQILKPSKSFGQILVSLANTKMSILALEGRELFEEASLKTSGKGAESQVAFGDINADDKIEIVQAVGNKLHFVST